CYQHSGGYTF
nr:immunoglobulin light chain junction region [Macaca mulatta]